MVDKVLHSQMPFTTGGQTINDRLTAAYHSLAGSQLGKTVCKATTEESIGPKKKHLDYLLHCTHEPNVSIPQLANFLIERTTNTNWCVVYKALITIHNIMCYGNERFCQYLASSNANFNLGNFLDKTTMAGYDMSTHVRRYGKYISEKIYTYRMVAFDFCKVKRGREDGFMRVMPADKLLKALPLLQGQIDALLEFQVTQVDLGNQIVNCSFLLMFRDLIRLFACYNDGIINLLEKYFEFNKKQCAEALDLYKKFVERMDKVGEFLKLAEANGVDKGEIPDLVKAPGSLLESLENHLASLEGGKPGTTTTSGHVTSPVAGTFQPFATFGDQNRDPFNTDATTAALEHKYGQDEYRANILKDQRQSGSQRANDLDLFSPNAGGRGRPDASSFTPHHKAAAIDDLLSLDVSPPSGQPPSTVGAPAVSSTNPFAMDFGSGGGQLQQPPFTSAWGASPAPGLFATNGRAAATTINGSGSGGGGGGPFADDSTFAKVFGSPLTMNNYGYGGNEYQTDYQLSAGGGYNQYAGSSRGVTPSPVPDVEPAGHNPFLTDAYGTDASSHIGDGKPADPAFQSEGSWHPEVVGYDQENLPTTEHAAAPDFSTPAPTASFNPFAPVQQASTQGSVPVDFSSGQFSSKAQAASAISSAIASPSSIASPSRPYSQPVGIPSGQQPQQQGMYPNVAGGFDGNFAVGGAQQYPPRFMTPPPQARMASSYAAPSEMGGSDQWNRGPPQPPRPPSAPATELQGLDPLGDLLAPQPVQHPGVGPTGAPFAGPGIMPPQQQPQKRGSGAKLLKGDLDSSLASLAENLSIGKTQDSLKKPVQWTGSGKPGAGQGAPAPNQSMNWNAPGAGAAPMYGGMPYQQQQQQQQGWGMAPGGMMMGAPMQPGYGQQPMPGFGGGQQMMYGGGQPMMGNYGMAGGVPGQMPGYGQPARMLQPGGQDPFGAL